MTLMQAFLCKLYRHKRLANFKVGIYLLTQKKGGYIYIYIYQLFRECYITLSNDLHVSTKKKL